MFIFSQPFFVRERMCVILSPSMYDVSSYRLYIGAAAEAQVKISVNKRINDIIFFNSAILLKLY